ncbi:SCO2322 family protein [Nonomuraea sp. NPDC050394]|uniref:SCO2322 family protein n=1 Tax=Nonomuraea sp. NPDC050394 TaxID=3364363 RepID=UPI0037958ADF
MLRRIRVAAGSAAAALALLTVPALANPPLANPPLSNALLANAPLANPLRATAPVSPGGPVPGAPDPDAVRVWSVWESDGTAWLAAAPGDVPSDGDVVGWRFAASPDGTPAEPPGGELAGFTAVCGQQAGGDGKRVAVLVDFGDADNDAYPGERPPAPIRACVRGTTEATAAQLLAQAARARVDARGRVVAVNDYPAREKGGTEASAPAASSAPGGPPLPLILGGAGVLVLLAGGALVATRRRARPAAHGTRY